VEILTRPEREVPADLRLQVLALQQEAWPPTDSPEEPPAGHTGHDPRLRPLSLLLVDEGRVLAALDVLSKELPHCGESYLAAGLATVVTARAERRRGHGLRLIRAARRVMQENGSDLALFTCDTPLAGFYEAGGYEVLPRTVLIGGTPDDPFPSDRFDKITLWAPFTPLAREHEADFRGARVALYPGPIDRLW
jgi:GNAT superfamily N-acetyltransferase